MRLARPGQILQATKVKLLRGMLNRFPEFYNIQKT